MAKYTELFIDYVKGGGVLPSSFSSIDHFTDLFIAKYCDCEIGFETEELFKIKLQYYADLYVEEYKKRINLIATNYEAVADPTKTTATEMLEMPFDKATAKPSAVTTTDTKGLTIAEAWFNMDKLSEKVRPLIDELAERFKPCFMGVY